MQRHDIIFRDLFGKTHERSLFVEEQTRRNPPQHDQHKHRVNIVVVLVFLILMAYLSTHTHMFVIFE